MKRILVIGAGLIGARHAQSVMAHPHCTLAGVVDPDTATHTDKNTRYFTNMADAPDDINGAIIATPTGLHAAHCTQAAERGWDILVEKPVADSLADADAIITATNAAGVQTLVGHHRRYHDHIDTLRAIIAAGDIGTPVTSTLIWAMKKPDSYFDGNWRTAGGSPVMINLVHDIDLLRYVLGDINGIAGLRGGSIRRSERLESGAVALSFTSGATATISFADTTPSPWGFEAGTGENPNIGTTGQDMWWITGTKGGVSFPSLTRWGGSDNWGKAAKPSNSAATKTNPLDAQLDHFIDVMDRTATPRINVTDARETLRITLDIETLLTQQAP